MSFGTDFLHVVLLTLGPCLVYHLFFPVFYCTTGWLIRPLATFQIQYYVRHSSILPKMSNDEDPTIWKRLCLFVQGLPGNGRDFVTPRPSPVSELLEKWLSGNPRIVLPEFSGMSSYVLFIPSNWGKTKACEYFMQEKKAKGIMIRGGKGRNGRSYEDTARRLFGWFCRFLSLEDFREAFFEALKNETLRPSNEVIYPEYVIVFFDDWDEDIQVDYYFALAIMHEFTDHAIHVIPVFITKRQEIANKLVYLNRGAKIRPFPECMDTNCAWNVGDGKEKYIIGATIAWEFPPWSPNDMAGIMAGQEVVIDSHGMCARTTNQTVPMWVPNDLSVFDGMTPGKSMQACSTYTKQQQSNQQGRQQPLIDIEIA